MKEIISKQNQIIVETAKLKDRKFREITNTFLIEGSVMLFDAIKASLKIKHVFVLNNNIELIEKLTGYENQFEVFLVSEQVLKHISDTVNPKELIAVLEKKDSEFQLSDKSLILDNIQDPGNMGTIIRTCACLGIKNIFAINCVDAFNPKCVRSTKSGIFYVNIIQTNYDEVIKLCKSNQIEIIAADFGGENLFKFEVPQKFTLVIGNEANGVNETLRLVADKVVTIPMKAEMESLNAGVSASVILYNFLGKGV